jgi:hypothetical protein
LSRAAVEFGGNGGETNYAYAHVQKGMREQATETLERMILG